MVVLGLILVVLAAAFAAGFLFGIGSGTDQWYVLTLDGFSGTSGYLGGLVTMLVFVVGLRLLRRGLHRFRARRAGDGAATGPGSAGGAASTGGSVRAGRRGREA